MEKRIEIEKRGRNPSEIKLLNLDNCKSTNILGLTDEFKNLEYLSLVNVGLTSLKGFPCLPNLTKLELNYNRISNGLKVLQTCPKLTYLNLSGNKLRNLKSIEPLAKLQSLKILDLFNNNIARSTFYYREKVFKILPNLIGLDGYDVYDEELEDDTDDDDDDEVNENIQVPGGNHIRCSFKIVKSGQEADSKRQYVFATTIEEHPLQETENIAIEGELQNQNERKKRKNTGNFSTKHLETPLIQFMNTPITISPVIQPNPDKSFFESLLPAVGEFSADDKLYFQTEVLSLIKKIRSDKK